MGAISIKINIADRTFPLSINSEEEEMVRKAAKQINERIDFMKKNYAFKDQQDLLSMVTIEFAVMALQNEHKMQLLDENTTEKISLIHRVLSSAFNS